MYLRDLQFVPNAPGDSKENNLALGAAVDHITDIFCSLLPPKYSLNGLGKVVIELGAHRTRRAQYWDGLGVGTWWWSEIDLRTFLALPVRQQEERALEILVQVLTQLAQRGGGDAAVVRQVAGRVRELGYRLTFPLKCSKSHPSRRWRAEVLLTYQRGGADVDLVLRHRSGEQIAAVPVLRESRSSQVWSTCWRGSWKARTYHLYDRFGKQVAEIVAPTAAA